MLYTKRDMVFISGFKQNCGFQGYITKHSDFNLYDFMSPRQYSR